MQFPGKSHATEIILTLMVKAKDLAEVIGQVELEKEGGISRQKQLLIFALHLEELTEKQTRLKL